jgi:hypothetical protein
MKIEAARRLLAEKQVTDPPNNNKDTTWQKKQEDMYKGRPKPPPDKQTPKGTFTSDNPGQIVNDLKQHSDDYGQASKRLNNYINRSGKNLDTNRKQKLFQTKDALRDAYGVKDPNEKPKPVKPAKPAETTSSPQAIPRWHTGNQPFLDTGIGTDEDEHGNPLLAAERLLTTR